MCDHGISEGLSTTFQKTLSFPYFPVPEDLNYLLTTPQIMEVIIEASSNMLDPLVPSTCITVGRHFSLSHEQPTLVLEGGPITTTLMVAKVDGNKILIHVKCYDGVGLICQGTHERAIVDKEKLRTATYKRAEGIL